MCECEFFPCCCFMLFMFFGVFVGVFACVCFASVLVSMSVSSYLCDCGFGL